MRSRFTIYLPLSIHCPPHQAFYPKTPCFAARKRVDGRQGGRQFIGIYIPALSTTVTVNQTTMQIPLPPAIFIGCGKRYDIHAVKQYPKNKHPQLYCYPSPNVGADNGGICRGDAPFPTCRPDTIHKAFKMFVESRFNNHLVTGKSKSFPQNVIELWKTLDGKEEFPMSELVPSYKTLGNWI
ncbi:MAG: hypothetical protein ACPGWR_26490 [Ardenticatenaceae bacterium]